VNLNGADLSYANLTRANLSRANLWAGNLLGTDLSCGNLNGADLSYANLTRANLGGADLSCAIAGYTIFCDMDLRNCYEITLPLRNVLGYSGVDG
jgi:uncharacterized protein YjbI with pentapeptide repeats